MSARPRVAVIQYPGVNCEYETARCLSACGLDGVVTRWNAGRAQLSECDAFVLPGGFSFQDRIRAGAVAARERITDFVFDAACAGKPVLGICNGAQVLVECGLVPGWTPGRIEASLAANHIEGRTGYLTAWIDVLPGPSAGRSPWLRRADGSVLPLPIAHAEGRFMFDPTVDRERLDSTLVTGLVYSDVAGAEAEAFPDNPNGSFRSLAGLLNPSGNVLAMMPHPERAFHLWQVPPSLPGRWGDDRRNAAPDELRSKPGPGRVFFESLAESLGGAG
ncbi:MAG: phosphoribosylformylglycinamidine synthase subunit PurQ [Candidatus Fermentibacter sp.]|nr:phosphoribosylformylglycinamidine synthase subunit PurQ [Candidatus Fermentibacter sp.]